MVIFNSYVKLPEGKLLYVHPLGIKRGWKKIPKSIGKIGDFPASHVWFTEGMVNIPKGFHQKKFQKEPQSLVGRVQKQPMHM